MAQTRATPAVACSRVGASAAHRWLQTIAFVGAALFYQLAAAESPGDSNAYKLEPGDRITVTVFGQPEVSGEILVDGAGNIQMPFVGSIAVKGLTVVECQKLVTDKLADGIFTQPSVNVQISELRPIYVLGDVRTPGAYPYRYGITAKGAVALAGGDAVTEQTQSVSDLILAEERVRELTFQRRALLVRQARLEAQRDGRDTFAVPPAPDSTEEGDMSDLFAIEKETLDSQTSMLKTGLDLMRSQQPRLQAEIDALNSQVATEAKQLELVSQRVHEYSRLVKKGLGLQSAELQLKLDEASHESNRWRLTAEISRLQRDFGDLSLRIHEAETTASKQVTDELREVRQRLKELDIALPSAREVREIRRQQAGSFAGVEVARSIAITRTRDNTSLVLAATDGTPLEPGDIVEIKKVLPPTSKSVALEPPAPKPDAGMDELATAAGPMPQQ